MDAGLAKVLNSTVGTSNMKSLDEVLMDNIKYVASDEILLAYDGGWNDVTIDGTRYKIGQKAIEFPSTGAVKIKAIIKGVNNNGSTMALSARTGSATNSTLLAIESAVISSAANVVLSIAINVTKGQRVVIWISSNAGVPSIDANAVTVCATPRLMGKSPNIV